MFCAGWGFLLSQPMEGFEVTLWDTPQMFVGGFLTIVMISLVELFKYKSIIFSRPSLTLKPWQSYPVGLIVFIITTFLFSSVWGLLFAGFSGINLALPLMVFGMASGCAFGGWVILLLFRGRFNA